MIQLKIYQSQPNICTLFWRFDLITRSSSEEHKTEVESKTKRAYTRSQRTASLTEYSKSALTDHANQANHTIDWRKTTVIDREQDRPTRWINDDYYYTLV